MRYIVLTGIIICCFVKTFSQDSVTIRNLRQMPVGLYFSQKHFLAKTPDVARAVKATINYIKNTKGDSAVYGYSFAVADTLLSVDAVYAFFDGENMYLQEGGVFFRLNGFGRFPYIFLKEAKESPLLLLGGGQPLWQEIVGNITMVTFAALQKQKIKLHHFNRKNSLVESTPESVGMLLKPDKDLYNEYSNEDKITTEVMIRYLNKLNERYPELVNQ